VFFRTVTTFGSLFLADVIQDRQEWTHTHTEKRCDTQKEEQHTGPKHDPLMPSMCSAGLCSCSLSALNLKYKRKVRNSETFFPVSGCAFVYYLATKLGKGGVDLPVFKGVVE
jgi:hypothetical protein